MAAIRLTLARIGGVLRAIIGVPDYGGYLAHMRRHHPGAPLLSAAELLARRQRDRFERPGGKCC